jgi:hypothetical protein
MQKIIIAFLCLFTSSVMGQTNYNTIMNVKHKRDSVRNEINLHLQKGKILDGTSKVLQVATFVSSIVTYHLYKNGEGNQMISIPLSIGVSALVTSYLAEYQYDRARQKRIKFACNF